MPPYIVAWPHASSGHSGKGAWIHGIADWLLLFTTGSYGIFDKIYELSIPSRFASITDILLNALGASIIITIATLCLEFRGKTPSDT